MPAGGKAHASRRTVDRPGEPRRREPVDVEPIVVAALTALEQTRAAPGAYSRFAPSSPGGRVTPDIYGSAGAANVLYTIARLPEEQCERDAFVRYIRSQQSRSTGLFGDPIGQHNQVHATANALSALELFDATPAHRVRAIEASLAPGVLEQMLADLDWVAGPWSGSHIGAGLYATAVLTGAATPELEERYFGWLDAESDPNSGLWRRGALPGQAEGSAPWFHHLASTFHYLFNYVDARRPWPFPGPLVDTCLRRDLLASVPSFGESAGFAEIDWVFCLTRSAEVSDHRGEDVSEALRAFAVSYAGNLLELVAGCETPFPDLHMLHGTVAALAELQRVLPDLLESERPLRLTLDRRPFL